MTSGNVEEPGFVQNDLPCSKCQYNLRGLAYTSKCPECATAVEESLGGRFLSAEGSAWLARLRIGVIFALCTVPAVLLRCFATYLFLVMMLGIIDLPQSMLTTSMFYWQSVVVISACLGLAANLLISTKPPSEGLPKRSEFMRKAIRLSALIAFVSHWGILFGPYGPASWVVGLGLAVPLVMAFKLTYLSHLASLIPKESLKRSCAGVRTIFVPALVAMFFVWDLFVLRAGISLGDDEWGIIILPVLLWLMAGGAWYILLLVRFYQALTVVAMESRGLETTELKCDDQINTS